MYVDTCSPLFFIVYKKHPQVRLLHFILVSMSHYITIQQAALFSKKSLQTVRRLIKTNRIKYRRQETPQGFTYLVEQKSLNNFLNAPVRAPYGAKYHTRHKVISVQEDISQEIIDQNPGDSLAQSPQKKPHSLLPQIVDVETVITHPKEEKEVEHGVYALGTTIGASSNQTTVDTLPVQPTEAVPDATPQNIAPHTNGKGQTIEHLLETIRDLQAHHANDKNKLYELLENFQRRALLLEEHIKQLEAPKPHRSWWKLW